MEILENILNFLVEPLQYGFILRGLSAGILASLVCSFLSLFVVWQGLSFLGDAVSHAILPGIVLAYSLGISLIVGAVIAALFAVLCIGFIRTYSFFKEDTAIGIVYAGFFALGLVFLSKTRTTQELSHILFGNILGVSFNDLIAMALVSIIVLALLIASFKEMLMTAFDPSLAASIGLSVSFIRYLQLVLLALTIVITVQTIGVVLAISFLIIPAATAGLLTRKLGPIIAYSLLTGLISTILGFYLSFYLDLNSGPVIVLVLVACFLLAMFGRSIRIGRRNG